MKVLFHLMLLYVVCMQGEAQGKMYSVIYQLYYPKTSSNSSAYH